MNEPQAELPTRSSDLSELECYELLGTTTVGRIAFAAGNGIKVLPVNYRLLGRDIYYRTSRDGTLALALGSDVVAFEVDFHSTVFATGWSVLLNGKVVPMDDRELEHLDPRHRPIPWATGDRDLHCRFVPNSVSGRQVRRPAS
ncbi:hypothetical protein GCM10009841_30330 [Microlunatus panaciterrae]|uniref:Nitroimidazol reductase NimA-like FMN-containing flavoprotein (Pyridoxamine 5'-phosphate oxidase superfamily) n=1 Tax=Microlunatus panaciterrae TaxID=400768 RepID=A0ABS2RG21_9ACTN|nr:pyridoxamine 5'-phosphate oxidase family protein [Microlunatus panaciterrae]MBM7797693.1 nitroimidazol reductase NimA-like FMN-containing flavoprotein (pyridoxamine 5'-phosphate oxidase superfamily) [Microlunatus panaciterrae]